jgi:4-diphosphocytidyl-2-C-methyl-D-erythritol kinase
MTDEWSAWPAPAKLNLFLSIVGRRADGYHLLQTVFHLLDWGDTARLRVRQDGTIARIASVPGVSIETDLTVRAANLLRERTGTSLGVEIELLKKIPLGGGLGGGSSDAATVLIALNELWRTQQSEDALADLGLGLGADVPVFVRGHSAWAEGIGERLTPIDLPARHYVILDPGVQVSTKVLFQSPELTRNAAPTKMENFISGTCTANAFAPVVRARYPRVAEALDWLGRFGESRLSGSGGCVFVAMDSADQAEAVVRDCPAKFAAYRAIGVNRSPLHETLDSYRSRMRKS